MATPSGKPWRVWVAHRGYWWISLLFLAMLAINTQAAHNLIVRITVGLTIYVYLAATVIQWKVHDGLCPTCAERLPIDPHTAAATRGRLLQWYHWTTATRVVAYTVVLISIGSLVVRIVVDVWGNVVLQNLVLTTLLVGWGAVTTWIYRTHSQLMPWCPYCRHRGGDDDPVVTPRPIPTGQVNA